MNCLLISIFEARFYEVLYVSERTRDLDLTLCLCDVFAQHYWPQGQMTSYISFKDKGINSTVFKRVSIKWTQILSLLAMIICLVLSGRAERTFSETGVFSSARWAVSVSLSQSWFFSPQDMRLIKTEVMGGEKVALWFPKLDKTRIHNDGTLRFCYIVTWMVKQIHGVQKRA